MKASLPPSTTDRTTAFAPPPTAGQNPVRLPFTVLIDQQEKAPFSFTEAYAGSSHSYRPYLITTRRVHLPTGDYSIARFDERGGLVVSYAERIVVERKSIADLFGSLAGKDGERRERFKAEHERMGKMVRLYGFGAAHVVIEGSLDDVRRDDGGRGAHPNAVLSTSIRWPNRYGVQWHWCGGRAEAERRCFALLMDAWEGIERERKATQRS